MLVLSRYPQMTEGFYLDFLRKHIEEKQNESGTLSAVVLQGITRDVICGAIMATTQGVLTSRENEALEIALLKVLNGGRG